MSKGMTITIEEKVILKKVLRLVYGAIVSCISINMEILSVVTSEVSELEIT